MRLSACLVIFIFGYELGHGLRYQYTVGPDGLPRLIDQQQTLTEIGKLARYNPDSDNEYHLFTRSNPTISQPLLPGNAELLANSNYDPTKRTVVIIHGGFDNILSDFNVVTIPAFVASDDINVIAVDWAPGSFLGQFGALISGHSVANFLNWLKRHTGQPAEDFHLVGFSLGAHKAGIVGRNVEGGVGYITALDAVAGWRGNEHIFRSDDALYTEAIWTNAGIAAYLGTLADVDFFPNGGTLMPGCAGNLSCNHARSYFYMAESIVSGGFTGTECATFADARVGTCNLAGRIQMGSRYPSYGASGIYYLRTNAASPFSVY